MKEINSVSIVGMGALGLLYADIIQNTLGKGVVKFVMDDARYDKYRTEVFTVNGIEKKFDLLPESEIREVSDLIIVAVKYTGLDSALPLIKKLTGPDTTLISVLNGISSEEILAREVGGEKIIYSVAQGMDAMKFGNSLKYTHVGELRIGIANGGQKERLDELCSFFDKAHNPYTVEEDIIKRMWNKFMLNVGINQTCMAFNATYSKVLGTPELNATFIGAMKEVIKIAEKKNISITENDINQWIDIIKTFGPDGTPSMGQDRICKRKSEVELFSGTVIKLGKEYNVEVPVNKMLYEKILQIEKEY